MANSHRLRDRGRIDRAKPIAFTFNGRVIDGFAGDTVASALLANGVHLTGRSFKYHRPRGIFSHGSEEPNALMGVDRGHGRAEPNNRATVIEAKSGLKVTSQNHWPSLERDIGAINNVLSPIFVAGFYYKTFMWPAAFWKRLYEPVIRRAAGLGVAPSVADPDRYQHRHAHCEVLIAGAGPAGLAAALKASEDSSMRVILADEQAEMGGALLHELAATIEGMPAQAWLAKTLATLAARKNVTLLPRTTVFGYYNHNHVALSERLPDGAPVRERLWQVRAGRVILATGAHERPLVFGNNDRPGIMLAESVRAYLNRYGVAAGRRFVIATNGDAPYALALEARPVGIVVAIVDTRPEAECRQAAAARAAGCEVLTGHRILSATGSHRVTGLRVASAEGAERLLPCDCIAMHGGWTPAVHLFSQSRGKLAFEEGLNAFVPGVSAQAEISVGAARGVYDLASCVADGAAGALPPPRGEVGAQRRAGGVVENGLDVKAQADAPPNAQNGSLRAPPPAALRASTSPRGGGRPEGKAFIDFQNDVTAKDIKLAVREGFHSVEHVKRYTTTGMATDQGKTSNMNALGVIAGALDKAIPQVGTTTFRLPYTPVTFNAFVGPTKGKLFDPARMTPIHPWAAAHGAKFEDVGQWKRAWYFPRGTESMEQAVARECRAVRENVGLFDASTLGKIEVVGPDAAEFMNRIYVNGWSKLEPGRCRYGLMLNEAGFILDDGVVARLAADRFHVTTTTGGAARVLAHMEDYLQTEWPELKVALTSISEQWAVIALQGPRARETLAPLVDGIDLSPAAFPHMAWREGKVCGVAARLFRVSFTGEAGYEINVPADFGAAVWEALMASGAAFNITPYGTEAMHVLRAEKGYIIVGQETDGTATPDDVGLGGMVGKTKPDFVGKRGLMRPDLQAAGRKQLVGLLTANPQERLEEGAQIVADPTQKIPMKMLGHVTSSYFSPACGHTIALAMLEGGKRWLGQSVHVTTPGGFATARVTEPVFVDPKGERLNG